MAEEKKAKSTPAKAVTAVKKDDAKPGFFKRVAKWFREMKSELKKVVWPTKKQLFTNTGVSLAVMISSAIVIWGFDKIASMLVNGLIRLTSLG